MKERTTQLLKSVALRANRAVGPVADRLGLDLKRRYELAYWRQRHEAEGTFHRGWYQGLFTIAFDVEPSFYANRRVLDIGCGPRGSLEWATMASRRVGLDPLVSDYRSFGISDHAMEYVDAPVEQIPFADEEFDIVTSINSLDHVDDLERAVTEIARVLADGGAFLLAVDVHPKATIAEPQSIPWTFAADVEPWFDVEWERHCEKPRGVTYRPDLDPFDHDDPTPRYGALVIRATRRERP